MLWLFSSHLFSTTGGGCMSGSVAEFGQYLAMFEPTTCSAFVSESVVLSLGNILQKMLELITGGASLSQTLLQVHMWRGL